MYRYVVELMGMVVEFIQNLEVKIKMVRAIPNTESYLSNLVSVFIHTRTQYMSFLMNQSTWMCSLELKMYGIWWLNVHINVLCFETTVYMWSSLPLFLQTCHVYNVSAYVNCFPHQNNGRTQLLAQVTEVENLYKQVLKRRGHSQTRLFDKDFQNENRSLFVQDTSGQ